jgi:hypothetical protein
MSIILSVIYILLVCVCAPVNAGNFSVSLGDTHAVLASSGTWWQKEYAHSLPHDVPSATIRYDTDMGGGSGLKVGIGYTYIGRFKSQAVAVPSDNAYTLGLPYPTSHWYGNEEIQGLFVAARKDFGAWYIEAGPMITWTNWTMHVPDWYDCVDSPVYGGPCLQPRKEPYDLTVGVSNYRQLKIRFGAGYKINEFWSIDYSMVDGRLLGAGWPGIVNGPAHTLGVRYTFD